MTGLRASHLLGVENVTADAISCDLLQVLAITGAIPGSPRHDPRQLGGLTCDQAARLDISKLEDTAEQL